MEINLGAERRRKLPKEQNFCMANAIKRFAPREQTVNVRWGGKTRPSSQLKLSSLLMQQHVVLCRLHRVNTSPEALPLPPAAHSHAGESLWFASPLVTKTKVCGLWLLKDRKKWGRTGYPDHLRDKAYREAPQTPVSASLKRRWVTVMQEWTARDERVNKLWKTKTLLKLVLL